MAGSTAWESERSCLPELGAGRSTVDIGGLALVLRCMRLPGHVPHTPSVFPLDCQAMRMRWHYHALFQGCSIHWVISFPLCILFYMGGLIALEFQISENPFLCWAWVVPSRHWQLCSATWWGGKWHMPAFSSIRNTNPSWVKFTLINWILWNQLLPRHSLPRGCGTESQLFAWKFF